MLTSCKIFISASVCLLMYILAKRWKYYKLIFQIRGPLGYPLIGMTHKLIKREEVLKTFEENEKKYGSIFFSWLGPLPFLVVSEPNIIQEILTSPNCINKGIIYEAIDNGTGRGLFSLRDPEWSLHRKLLNPAFGHKVLLSFISIFNQEAGKLVEIFDSFSKQDELNLIPIFQKLTLNIATRTTMGKSLLNNDGNNEHLLNSYQRVLENMTEMCFSPWLCYKFVRCILGKDAKFEKSKQEIHNFVRNLINEKLSVESVEVNQTQNKNVFLNLAIEQLKKGIFSWRNVEDEANVIVFGAFETTANTIAYTLLMLAMHPQYQEKAYDEIVSIFSDSGIIEVSFDDTKQMVYMDMILNETMRLMAPVPLVARQTSADTTLSNGIIIPRGVQIAINIFLLHRNKKIWGPEAHSFNPDNFLPSNLSDKHPYAFIPFTKGLRNCIGWRYALLSAKITLAILIRNYQFTTTCKIEDLEFVEDITIKLKNVPLIKVHKRI